MVKSARKEFRNKTAAVAYIMEALARIDAGKMDQFDFVAPPDVDGFCKAIGFKQTWAKRTYQEIVPPQGQIAVNVCDPTEAKIVLDIIKQMIVDGMFVSRDGTRFDKTIINDFLPRSKSGFQGERTLGHAWEWQYALAVELEHGARVTPTSPTTTHCSPGW